MIWQKRHTSSVLANARCCLAVLLCIVSVFVHAQNMQGSDDFTNISTRLLEDAKPVDSLLTLPDSEGKWADINYDDTATNGWQPYKHWERLVELARRYHFHSSTKRDDTTLANSIVKATNFWYIKNPVARNWWWNVIGIPLKIGEVMLIMDTNFSETQKAAGYKLMSIGIKPDSYYTTNDKATGQNAVWVATVHLMMGLLQKDRAIVERASNIIKAEVVITPHEGIQADYSFHQHGPQLYSGGYGKGFARDISNFISVFHGTAYAFPKEKIDIFSSYILDGLQWATYKSTLDYSTLGREISRNQEAGRAATLIGVCNELIPLDLPRKAEFGAMASRLEGSSKTLLIGNRHFWKSDFTTHHAPGFYSSIKMASSRVRATESGNSENLKAWYLGRGVQFIFRNGLEYNQIFPVWDWQRLPGTLAEQKGPLLLFTWGLGAEGKKAYAGGVSDGRYGATAYDYDYDNVKAKRAWFWFDKEVVCLAAGISCPTDNALLQSINQCLQNGDVTIGNGNKNASSQKIKSGRKTATDIQWIHHDSIAYFFPQQRTVTVKAEHQSGSWKSINNQVSYSSEIISKPVFSAWIDLGKRATNENLSYIIVPNISATDASRYKSPITILQNDSTVQAIHQTALNLTAAAFYQPSSLNVKNGLKLSVDKPVLLLHKETTDSVSITLSSPENKSFTVEVTLNKKLLCNDCKWSSQKGTTTVAIELPSGEYAGQSLTKSFKKAKVANKK